MIPLPFQCKLQKRKFENSDIMCMYFMQDEQTWIEGVYISLQSDITTILAWHA